MPEYASAAWDPCTAKDVNRLEIVQCIAVLENEPILVLTLNWDRSERIGIGPGLVKVLTPIWR